MSQFIDIQVPHHCHQDKNNPYTCFYDGPWMGYRRNGYDPATDHTVCFQYNYQFYRAKVPVCNETAFYGYGWYRQLMMQAVAHVSKDRPWACLFKENYGLRQENGEVNEALQMYAGILVTNHKVEAYLKLDLSDYHLPADNIDPDLAKAYNINCEYLTKLYGKRFRELTEIEKLNLLSREFKSLISRAPHQYQRLV